jgi:hypothetical protein
MTDKTNETFKEIVRGVELDDSLIRVYEAVEDTVFRDAITASIDAPLIHGAAQQYASEYDPFLTFADVNDFEINLQLVKEEMQMKYKLSQAELAEALFICTRQINQLRAAAKMNQKPGDVQE